MLLRNCNPLTDIIGNQYLIYFMVCRHSPRTLLTHPTASPNGTPTARKYQRENRRSYYCLVISSLLPQKILVNIYRRFLALSNTILDCFFFLIWSEYLYVLFDKFSSDCFIFRRRERGHRTLLDMKPSRSNGQLSTDS